MSLVQLKRMNILFLYITVIDSDLPKFRNKYNVVLLQKREIL